MSQTTLTRLALIEQPTMAATLSRMERDGLIERKPDLADGRSSLINLSPAAIAKSAEVIAVIVNGREEMLAGFDAAERQLFGAMLLRVIANLEQAAQSDATLDQPRGEPTSNSRLRGESRSRLSGDKLIASRGQARARG